MPTVYVYQCPKHPRSLQVLRADGVPRPRAGTVLCRDADFTAAGAVPCGRKMTGHRYDVAGYRTYWDRMQALRAERAASKTRSQNGPARPLR